MKRVVTTGPPDKIPPLGDVTDETPHRRNNTRNHCDFSDRMPTRSSFVGAAWSPLCRSASHLYADAWPGHALSGGLPRRPVRPLVLLAAQPTRLL